MRCLSLWQPWATLVAIGAKRIETRSWSTDYRGPVAIHASKRWTPDLRDLAWSDPFRKSLECEVLPLPFGAIVAVVDLVDVVSTGRVRDFITNQERAFGDYTNGRYAWRLDHIRRLESPITLRAFQGLFTITDQSVLSALSALNALESEPTP